MKPNNGINVIATAAFADLRYGKKKRKKKAAWEDILNVI